MSSLDESLLKPLPPFADLTQSQIREILDLATPRLHADGATIFHEGEPAERFYLLLDGMIRVVRTTIDGEQMIPLHIPPGHLFGIAMLFHRGTYPGTAIAAGECMTLSWPARLWEPFVTSYPGFSTAIWKDVGNRVMELHDRLTEMATRAVEQRVATSLLRLAEQSGRQTNAGIEIGFPVTRANIAAMTGATVHTVSRLLSAWERDGIVNSGRRHIVLTDPHRLVMIADPTVR